MSDTVIINSQQVDDLLNKLNDKDQKNKWLFDAVMSGAKVLQQSARHTNSRKITGYQDDGKHLKREGKGHYTGKITATYFFREARDSSDSAINEAMMQSIDKSIKNAIKQ